MRFSRRHAVGLAALALALPGAWVDARVFVASWLVAWWYVLGLALGGMVNAWIHRLSGGRWGEALRPAALAAARRLPWLLVLFLPVALGMASIYPWMADPSGGWAHGMSRPAFVAAWLDPVAFAVRAALYAALWWMLSRPTMLDSKGRSAAALAVYLLSVTLASVDLLMSLVPGWYSTAFGLVVASGQALGGTALGVLLLARRPRLVPPPEAGKPPLWRDYGNLLLMWLMTWAYVAFMEFLVIWAEDLPHEIAWFLPRLRTGWSAVGVALVLLQFALPLLALLQRRLKDRPGRLAAVAALLLGTQLLNTAWLVLPSVAPHSLLGWWLVPLLALGMAVLAFGGAPAALDEAPVPRAAGDDADDDEEMQRARP